MRILVVDDEPDLIESVRLGFTLQWREIDVLGAATGEAGLDAVEHEHPDIVLLDIGLPDIDGFEVLRQIRAFSDVPVVMLESGNMRDSGDAAVMTSARGQARYARALALAVRSYLG